MALCPAIFDRRILPLYVTDLPQAFAERGHEVRPFGGGRAAEQTDHRHSGLLRPRRERLKNWCCGSRAAEKRDELASPHRALPLKAPHNAGGLRKSKLSSVFEIAH